MPSDLHSIECRCRECRVARNLPKGPNRFLLVWVPAIAFCLAAWALLFAAIAPDLLSLPPQLIGFYP